MDIASYRLSEALGRRAIRSIGQSAIHVPEAFDQATFPLRAECHEDLAAYFDAMPPERFDSFMREMDGLGEAEVEEFSSGLVEFAKFFVANFNANRIPLPLSEMIAHYCAFRKLRSVPERSCVLEIGPGSGHLPFFLVNDKNIKQYHQVDTAEVFYIIQNMINKFLFGHTFLDHAQIDHGHLGLGNIDAEKVNEIRNVYTWLESHDQLDISRSPRVEHFPWWKTGELFKHRYDVILSNANLTEFTKQARSYYAALASFTLKPTGVLIAQCAGQNSGDLRDVLREFLNYRLVPLLVGTGLDMEDGRGTHRQFATVNVVLATIQHPIAQRRLMEQGEPAVINVKDDLTRSLFTLDRPAGTVLTRQDLHKIVSDRLSQVL